MGELRRRLAEQDVEILHATGDGSEALASFIIIDPDGNPILVDQHV